MTYKYIFDEQNCWYKNACQLYTTQDCNSHCHRYMEMHYLMQNSGLPKKHQTPTTLVPYDCDIEMFCKLQDIKNSIVDFVNTGQNLYIYSEQFGNGKTSWATKMLGKYFDEVWCGNGFRCRGLFISVPQFISNLNSYTNSKEFELLKQRIETVDLVVWDDISVTGASQQAYLSLATYIDIRQVSGLANIFTGNFNQEQLKEVLSDRLVSRIWNASIRVELLGQDRRAEEW